MADLKTRYAGLILKNPIVVGASNIVSDNKNLRSLEEAGAAAIVYKSLFEEQIQLESYQMEQAQDSYSNLDVEHETLIPFGEHAGPALHLLHLREAKKELSIPLIGSLNCVNKNTWVEYAGKMEQTGIDALELNFYQHNIDFTKEAAEIEDEQIDILKAIRKEVRIPLIVKLSPFYTNALSLILKMDSAKANGFVLFNRLFQPDINVDIQGHHYPYNFSSESDNRLALRYAGLLYSKTEGSIISNTGIFSGRDVVKMLLAGADAVQVVSAIYKRGIHHIAQMIDDLKGWMVQNNYDSIDEFKGKLAKENLLDPFAYKRAQYVDILMKSSIFLPYHPKLDDVDLQQDINY